MEESQFMQIMTWIQDSPVAVWVAEAETIWAYPTILMLHTLGLAVLVGANAIIDLRLLGYAPEMPLQSLRKLFGLMWAALTVNTVTGVLLFMSAARVKSILIMFYVKLTFIALAIIVLLRIRRIVFDADASLSTPAGARRLAVLSLVFWLAATTAGRMMAYWEWTF